MSTTTTEAPDRVGRSGEPRADKVAKVAEIAERLEAAPAVFVVEYRGLTVADLAAVRGELREAGAAMTVYKDSLARRAATAAGLDVINDFLTGPTAITFAGDDTVAAAKALDKAAKANPQFVLRGGAFGAAAMSVDDITALAELPSRDELLAKFAGGLQAPLVKTAGLLQALPRNFAYGLSALIEQRAETAA